MSLPLFAQEKVGVIVVGAPDGKEELAEELRQKIRTLDGPDFEVLGAQKTTELLKTADDLGVGCSDLVDACIRDLGFVLEVDKLVGVKITKPDVFYQVDAFYLQVKSEAPPVVVTRSVPTLASEDFRSLAVELITPKKFVGEYEIIVNEDDVKIFIDNQIQESHRGFHRPGTYLYRVEKEGFVSNQGELKIEYGNLATTEVLLAALPQAPEPEPVVEEEIVEEQQNPMMIAGAAVLGVGVASSLTVGIVALASDSIVKDNRNSVQERTDANNAGNYSAFSLIGTGAVLIAGGIVLGVSLAE